MRKGVHRPDSTSPTVSDVALLWLDRCESEGLEPEVIAGYEGNCRVHIEPATVPKNIPNGWSGTLGDIKLSKLNTPLCEAFRDQLLKTNSRAMARHVLVSFKAMLKDAQRRGLIAYNPAQPVLIGRDKRGRVPIRIGVQIPDREDVRVILAASCPFWRVLFATAAFTGMRASELRGLTWPDVDLDRATIEVRQRADWCGFIGRCKSESAYRTIQIGHDVVDMLLSWRQICPPTRLMLVFPLNFVISDDDGVVIPRYLFLDEFHEVQHGIEMERSDGKAKYSFHALRHFYASIMIDAGTPPKRLQNLLGHSTLAMTMDTYGHLFAPDEEEAARINTATAAVLRPRHQ
jgi:integrase